jgi:hypothetical protein
VVSSLSIPSPHPSKQNNCNHLPSSLTLITAFNKMHLGHKIGYSHGHLSTHDEQAPLHHRMHLHDSVYLQLQVTVTVSSATAPNIEPRLEQHHQQHQQQEDDCRIIEPATILAHDSAHDGRLCCLPASASSVDGKRRTKRQFATKRCHRCDSSFTSQWRSGPRGPSTYVVVASVFTTTT